MHAGLHLKKEVRASWTLHPRNCRQDTWGSQQSVWLHGIVKGTGAVSFEAFLCQISKLA